MLDAMRKATGSLVAKILFGILVLSFGVWGIGDIFRGAGRGTSIAQVGEQKISGPMVIAEYQRYIDQLRPMFGGKLDAEQAKHLGFPRQVMQRLIAQAVFDQAAHDLGLAVSDEVVRANIMEDPRVKGPGGKFDEIAFRQLLGRAGYTEDGFVNAIRREIARNELTESLRAAGKAPKNMVEMLYGLRAEKRVADTVTVPDSAFADVGEPDEAELAAYHQERAAAFTAPEYRAVTYLALTPAALAKDIEVSDDDLHQAYEDGKERFAAPEKRTLEQMVLPDEAAAKHAEELLAAGRDFAKVAKEVANEDKDAIELGTVTKDKIPEALREPAFTLAQGAVSEPVKTAFGWHILKAVAVEPGRVKGFDEIKDSLRREVAEDRARDKIDAESNRLEDLIAGGASLEEAAEKTGLKPLTIDAVDARGQDAAGKPVAGIPGGNFLQTVFGTAEGKESALTEIPDGGYFAARVNKITPSALRPIDSMREVLISAWKGDTRRKRSKARADEIAEKIKSGKSITDAAAEYGLKTGTTQPFKRGDTDALPEAAVNALFEGGMGTAATAETPDGAIVAQVKQVIPADPASDKDGVAAVQQQLDLAFGTDLLVQYGAAIENRYPVTVNTKAFDSLF